jgi:L-alanine-DL-glutamate epimerase-like enolase superfamily enzyme
MKTTEVKVYQIKGRHWPRFPVIFVEVLTDEGISGIGESLSYRTSGVKKGDVGSKVH